MQKFKLVFCFAALFAASVLFAQKPNLVIVWPEPGSNDTENRIASLVWEYYKSELATHSGLKVLSADVLAKAKESLKLKGILAPAQIKKLTGKTESDTFCAVSLGKGKKQRFMITVKVYTADGKLKSTLTREFNTIEESDFVTVAAARETAVAIRGNSDVDTVNMEREKRLLKELQDSKKDSGK